MLTPQLTSERLSLTIVDDGQLGGEFVHDMTRIIWILHNGALVTLDNVLEGTEQ